MPLTSFFLTNTYVSIFLIFIVSCSPSPSDTRSSRNLKNGADSAAKQASPSENPDEENKNPPNAENSPAESTEIIQSQAFKENALVQLNLLRSTGRNCGTLFFPAVGNLSWNQLLEKAALRHSSDMMENGLSSHTGSDKSEPSTRIKDSGYVLSSGGENVAKGFVSTEATYQAWIASPPHCKNIMAPYFKDAALGRVDRAWTLVFASSR